MKPLYLEIEGVKSIAEKQVINFERVAKSGIFGIFGKTGSGKTTILDSIVLAIYGSTTSSVDNKDFVNLGKNSAKVNLIFSVTGQGVTNKYRVERIYKFDGKRKNLTANAKLWEVKEEGEYCIAENTSQVNKALKEDIIGLSKEDFLKCIALPQGAFSEFIKLTRSERLTFIGKLFGLEKYGSQLAVKISQKDKLLKEEEDRERGKLEGIEGVDSESLEKNKKDLEEITLLLQSEKQKRDELKEKYQKAKEQIELVKNRAKKNDEYQQKLAYKSVIEGYTAEIALLDKVLDAKVEIESYVKTTQELKKLKADLEQVDKVGEELTKRKKGIYAQKQLVPDLSADLLNATVKKEGINQLEPLINSLTEHNKQIENLRKRYKEDIEEIKRLNAKIEIEKENCKKLEQAVAKYNVHDAVNSLATNLSNGVIGELVNERIVFLNELCAILKGETLINESAVNQLIEREMGALKQILKGVKEISVREALASCIEVIDKNAEYTKKLQDSLALIANMQTRVQGLSEKSEENKKMGTDLAEQISILKIKINAVLQGQSMEDALKSANRDIERLTKRIQQIETEFEEINEKINQNALLVANLVGEIKQKEKHLYELDFALENKLTLNGITFERAVEILAEQEQIEKKRKIVENYQFDLKTLSKEIGELNEKLKEGVITEEEYQKIAILYQESEDNLTNINKKFGEINRNYEIGLKNSEKWCIISNNVNRIFEQRKKYGKLYELVKESRFMEFIAEVYLKEIAHDAESRVLSLTSGRYGLSYVNGNFFVSDNLSGCKMRPVLSLSGGETFLVSLSLALALSSQISRRALKTLEFFFLDEGFGTLDDDLIDAVTGSLEKLQKENLTVGLITHVTELKNRIGAKIEVTPATAVSGTVITTNY